MEDRDVYYNFLEALRKSGVTNMFGATPYLEAEFEELTHAEAMEILKDWMANYSELSKRLGWDKSMTPSESGSEEEDVVIEDDEDYYNLFHEDVSKDIINPFLKQLAEEDKMDELNNADHIWDTEFPFFVVLYKDGNVKFINQSDEIVVYDNIEEICSDFGIDLDDKSIGWIYMIYGFPDLRYLAVKYFMKNHGSIRI